MMMKTTRVVTTLVMIMVVEMKLTMMVTRVTVERKLTMMVMKMMGDNDHGDDGTDNDGGDEAEDESDEGIWQQTLNLLPTSLPSTAASCLPPVGVCDTCDIR